MNSKQITYIRVGWGGFVMSECTPCMNRRSQRLRLSIAIAISLFCATYLFLVVFDIGFTDRYNFIPAGLMVIFLNSTVYVYGLYIDQKQRTALSDTAAKQQSDDVDSFPWC